MELDKTMDCASGCVFVNVKVCVIPFCERMSSGGRVCGVEVALCVRPLRFLCEPWGSPPYSILSVLKLSTIV